MVNTSIDMNASGLYFCFCNKYRFGSFFGGTVQVIRLASANGDLIYLCLASEIPFVSFSDIVVEPISNGLGYPSASKIILETVE